MKRNFRGITTAALATAAFTGLMTGSAKAELLNSGGVSLAAAEAMAAPGMNAMGTVFGDDTHSCKGQNACKGKGGCKAGDNGCKGKNSCKGHGGCATDGSKK